jgi:hypothetical protein
MNQSPAARAIQGKAGASPGRSPVRRGLLPTSIEVPLSPGVTVTTPDGVKVVIPTRVINAAAAAAPAPGEPVDELWIFDSGWGGVNMVVELYKQRIAAIVHIKNSFAGFPIKELEDALRGMPGGSTLEMRTTVDGVDLIAMGAKYNSKTTCFFCCPVGAAPTTEGLPYVTKFPDGDRNVMTREVPRPALVARYFGMFNACDIHDHRRQHELGLEMKWVTKGEHAGKFRMATTIFGMTVVDAMLALRCQSHPEHDIRSMTTKDFAEFLAEEMVENVLDGKISRPKENKRKRVAVPYVPNAAGDHVLAKIGEYTNGMPVQLHCVMCHKKATTCCTGCKVAICQSAKRTCYTDHRNGDGPAPKAAYKARNKTHKVVDKRDTSPPKNLDLLAAVCI